MPQHISTVRIFLVHKLSIVNRDPDEIKAIYIQYARQSSVSTFWKEVDEYCGHLWQREIKQGLMYSLYLGVKVRNSNMEILARYPKKNSVKTLRVLMNDFEVREVLFRRIPDVSARDVSAKTSADVSAEKICRNLSG